MKYSFEYTPPAPYMTVKFTKPFSDHSLELKAKLDTGADITVLPQHVIDKLGLIPSSLVSVLSFDGKKVQRYTYFVNISFQNFEYRMVEVVGAERKDALLGRDILNRLKTILDGKTWTSPSLIHEYKPDFSTSSTTLSKPQTIGICAH